MRQLRSREVEWFVQNQTASNKARTWTWAKRLQSELLITVLFHLSQGTCCLVTLSCLTLCSPRTIAHWGPVSPWEPRQEYRSGLPFPSPGDLPYPRIEPTSPAMQADSLPLSHLGTPYSTWQCNEAIALKMAQQISWSLYAYVQNGGIGLDDL